MKGIVFTLRKPARSRSPHSLRLPDFRGIFRRYGVVLLFVTLLLLGLAAGAVFAGVAEGDFLKSLDFLFTTNLSERLSKGALGVFCACFASDFLFLTTVYLLGMAPWGLPFGIFTVLFKGFGTGLTAASLFLNNGVGGMGFYLLVLLPGTFLFCVALAVFASHAFTFSRNQFFQIIGREQRTQPPLTRLRVYSSRYLSALIMTFCAALLDTVLWTLFAGAFHFT